jgi:thioredoxin reductase (NADPH)
MKIVEAAIIGAGPAGIAASIQLKRFGVDFVLVERHEPGGLLRNANLVENYPGFPQGVSGPQLVKRMLAHMQSVGVQVIYSEVSGVTYTQDIFHLDTQAGKIQSRILVIASGTKPRTFEEFDIPENLRKQVLYEVYPLIAEKGKQVAIVGAGDAAFDYALNLARYNRVAILNRSDRTQCLPLLWQRAIQSSRITYHASTQLKHLHPGFNGKLLLECQQGNTQNQFEADYLLGALGRVPQCDFLTEEFNLMVKVLTEQKLLYWIGDVQNGRYRQTAIAVGDGIRAAMQIYQSLQEVSL